MNLEALLEKADKAKPGIRAANGRWLELYPVYERLRQRKLTGKDAVAWLIKEGAVPSSDAKKAEEAMQKLHRRRK